MKQPHFIRIVIAVAFLLLLLLLLMANPCIALSRTHTTAVPIIKINGKTINNYNKLNLDTGNNYITLKGHYSRCVLKTTSKKIKLKYWGISQSGKEWEVLTKKSGKVRMKVVRNGKVIKSFTLIVCTPRIVSYEKGSYVGFRLKGAGDTAGETKHKIKWICTPVGNYGNNDKTIIERHHSAITCLTIPGIYKVKVKLLGRVYKLKKKVMVLEMDNDFEIKSFKSAEKVLPHYVIQSLYLHGYTYNIVKKKTLDKYGVDLKESHTISGIHDLEKRKIIVSNTSATVVLHEIGHFVSCSFQKVNGVNLTQTTEWQKIYRSEKSKFWQMNSFNKIGDTYAATNANEFFAECFQQFYLVPQILKRHCPQAYRFVERTMRIDFFKIANISW